MNGNVARRMATVTDSQLACSIRVLRGAIVPCAVSTERTTMLVLRVGRGSLSLLDGLSNPMHTLRRSNLWNRAACMQSLH